jgi:hypothetical protein
VLGKLRFRPARSAIFGVGDTGEDELSIQYERKDFFDHPLCPFERASLPATRTEASYLSGARDASFVLLVAVWMHTAESREARGTSAPGSGAGDHAGLEPRSTQALIWERPGALIPESGAGDSELRRGETCDLRRWESEGASRR